MMKCGFFSLTDTGRVRVNNEDSVAVLPALGLVVLADGMGGYNAGEVATTLVTAVVHRNRLTVGHVGDSRAYRLRQGRFMGLTKDHSLLQEPLDAGLIPPHLARVVQYKNVVTRAIGVSADVHVEVHEHRALAGDTYLFCSDGLNDMLTDDEMAQVLLQFGPLERAGRELLRRANEAGGRDNLSLVLAQCSPEPAHPANLTASMAQ